MASVRVVEKKYVLSSDNQKPMNKNYAETAINSLLVSVNLYVNGRRSQSLIYVFK